MIKAVLFDLDGTLLDREASVEKFIHGQYDRLREFVGHMEEEVFCQRFITLDANGYVWKDKVYEQLVAEFEITGLAATDFLFDYMNAFKHACVPFPNLHEMLQQLQRSGVRFGMITNGKDPFQMDNIEALGIKDYFETILISEREGVRKPDAEIFVRALEQMNVLPAEAVFVGDHPTNDVLAAKQVGMYGIWKTNKHYQHVDADAIVDDLLDLLIVIKGLK